MARYSDLRIGLALAVVVTGACAPVASTTPIPLPIPTPSPATRTCADSSVIPASTSCPVPAPAPMPAPVPVGPFTILFEWGKAEITPDAAAILDNTAAAYAQTAKASVMLAAYADKSGSGRVNLALSQRRADAAKAYLVGRGVAVDAITTQVSGESRLLVDTANGVREAQNRRVDVTIVPGSGR